MSPVARSCENDNEYLCPVKCGKFVYIIECQVLKQGSDTTSYLRGLER